MKSISAQTSFLRLHRNGAAPGDTTWTPDGRIVFGSRASGNPDLWIMGSDGRNQKQLTDDAEGQGWPSVTSDGRYVVYASGSTTLQVWRMDIDGSNPKQLTTGIGSFVPHRSPDGKWVVYSIFGTNGFNLWKVSIDGGEPIQVTNKFADLPAVSPDGKLVACYSSTSKVRTRK